MTLNKNSMKKILIITYHKVYNYGSSLQAYATKKAFEEFSSNVEIINFVPNRYKNYGSFKQVYNEKKYYTNNPIKCLLMTLKSIKIRERQKKAFDKFDHYLDLGEKYDSNKLYKEPIKADLYVTGSDQVWNNFYGGFEKCFFWDFIPKEANRVAYSASFGKSEFTKSEMGELNKLLKKYKLISVRENTGKTILDSLNIPSIQLLDPVYYINKNKWDELKDIPPIAKGKYILIYQLDSHGNLIQEAKKLQAKFADYKIIFIETEKKKRYKDIIYVTIPTVNEFLGLFSNASFIITDSFHGTTFSICMNKNFSCVLPKRYANRIESVLSILKLDNRVISKDRDILSIYDEPINWLNIEKKLSIERSKMKTFISDCIKITNK